MHRFQLVPRENISAGFHVISPNASELLGMASRSDYSDFDIMRDGNYAFSLRKNGEAEFWTIFRRVRPAI